jgi:hypothetical protein
MGMCSSQAFRLKLTAANILCRCRLGRAQANSSLNEYSMLSRAGARCGATQGYAKGNATGLRRLQLKTMLRRSNPRGLRRGTMAFALLAVLLGGALAARPQARRPPAITPKAGPDPATLSVPFRAGENLEFRGGWQFYNSAATLKLAVIEQRDFSGRPAWHFQAQVTTLDPLRYIFILDDQFDSYSDTADLSSRQYEAYIREQNKREDRISRMSHDGEPAPSGGPAVRVPAGTRDPLSALYFLRSVDWARTPSVNLPVYDGKKLYELRARVARASESAEVPAGNFTASRIDLRVFERGRELLQVRISLWLARDAACTPVLIEAELPFGSVRAELTRDEGP